MKRALESENGLPRSVASVAKLPMKGYVGATVYCEADQNLYVYTGSGYAAIGGGDGATVSASVEYVAGNNVTITDGTGANAGKKVISATGSGGGSLDTTVTRWYSTKYIRELPAAANDGTFFYVEEDDGVYCRALGIWRKVTFNS